MTRTPAELSKGARLLLAAGLTQTQIAERAGVSQKQVSRTVSGEGEVADRTRIRIFRAIRQAAGLQIALDIEEAANRARGLS